MLEARGVLAAVRHKCRSQRNFHKRHLHLNDNLANVLCLEKGRSASFPMLRACRRLCALAIASDVLFHHRWVPSERNPADHASRQWESERKQQVCKDKAAPATSTARRSWTRELSEGFTSGGDDASYPFPDAAKVFHPEIATSGDQGGEGQQEA